MFVQYTLRDSQRDDVSPIDILARPRSVLLVPKHIAVSDRLNVVSFQTIRAAHGPQVAPCLVDDNARGHASLRCFLIQTENRCSKNLSVIHDESLPPELAERDKAQFGA